MYLGRNVWHDTPYDLLGEQGVFEARIHITFPVGSPRHAAQLSEIIEKSLPEREFLEQNGVLLSLHRGFLFWHRASPVYRTRSIAQANTGARAVIDFCRERRHFIESMLMDIYNRHVHNDDLESYIKKWKHLYGLENV